MKYQITVDEISHITISQVLAQDSGKLLMFEYEIDQSQELFVVVVNGKRQVFYYLGSAVDAYNEVY